jgi:cytochrome P450
MTSTRTATSVSDERLAEQFDRRAEPGSSLCDTRSRLRSWCPGAHGTRYEDFWIVTSPEDVEWVVQDWETFASLPALSMPLARRPVPDVANEADEHLRSAFRKLIDEKPGPVEVEAWAGNARDVAARLIDGVVARGGGDFTGEFVLPYLGATLFGLVLDTPDKEIGWLTATATLATGADHRGEAKAWAEITARLRGSAARGAAIGARQLLVLGWLETLGDALSHMTHQLCRYPLVLRQLRDRPHLIPTAVNQLLRIDAATVSVARIATRNVEIGGRRLVPGERVLACLPSAAREDHRSLPDDRTEDSAAARPGASGMDAHRCVQSELARINLQVALEAIVGSTVHVHLEDAADTTYGSALRRTAFSTPISMS